jgi:hypothetical protein
MNGMSQSEVRDLLGQYGFDGRATSPGGWQRWVHADGSEVNINWNNGRVVRTAAPRYGPDGSRINMGQRIAHDGMEIPLNLNHDQHPLETLLSE